ncbi:unnamed protein product [Owenia fusiformis]|uniref:Uncharacterized protein n=1 Tax=Owenia fusiformis TaxID=6347 RepID=A0A8J1UJ97_OWEFU|nr:unnamed protein product [Owenia fusiformis]
MESMASNLFLWSSYLLCFCLRNNADAGNIFIQPPSIAKNSRMAAMEKIAMIMADAGHNITYLAHTEYKVPDDFATAGIHVMKYQYPNDKVMYVPPDDMVQEYISMSIIDEMKAFMERGSVTEAYISNNMENLYTTELITRLKETEFDLSIFDSIDFVLGTLMKTYLDAPTVLWSNAGFEFHCADWLVPLSLSSVPNIFTGYSNEMTVMERMYNVYYYINEQYYMRDWIEMKEHYHEVYATKIGLNYTKGKYLFDADLLFVQSNFAYYYPRPLLPNVIPVLGLKDRKANPLVSPFKEFVDGAEHGFIILTFGSMPTGMDAMRREVFASVFAKLKQRVIWRYGGPTPKTLGNNTMVVKWIPQNDLLSHRNLRVFMTHCGASGSAEAVYNGVPVIGIPLFYDQRQHCGILTHRHKMGRVVIFDEVNTELLSDALDDVLKNPVYKQNALKAQALARDQPMSASQTIKYWAEYVMKHNGADHLKSVPTRELNFFQYYLLDIIFSILGFAVLVIVMFMSMIRKCFSRNKPKGNNDLTDKKVK